MPCIYACHHLLLNPTPCFFPSITTFLFYINKSNTVPCDILGKVLYFFQISPSALAENFQFSSFRNSFTILNFVCSFWKWKINAASLKLVLQKYECITGDMLTSCLTLSGYISVVTSLLKIYSFETAVLVTQCPVSFLKLFFLLHLVRPKVKLIVYVDYIFHTVVSWELICLCSCFKS